MEGRGGDGGENVVMGDRVACRANGDMNPVVARGPGISSLSTAELTDAYVISTPPSHKSPTLRLGAQR